MRRGHTVLELVIAMAVMTLLIFGGSATLKYFTRPAAQGDVSLDQLGAFQIASERVDHDMREARTVVFPTPTTPPTALIIVRNFDGQQMVYYYSAGLRQLRRAWLDPSGLAREDAKPVLENLDRAFFTVSVTGLVSWGLFSTEMFVLGSAGRENR